MSAEKQTVSGDVPLTPKQQELADLMSEISQNCYCAGWISGLEYAIWNAVLTDNLAYGMGEISRDTLNRIVDLALELDGWVIWVDDQQEPGLPVEQWGNRFVTAQEWSKMLNANYAPEWICSVLSKAIPQDTKEVEDASNQ